MSKPTREELWNLVTTQCMRMMEEDKSMPVQIFLPAPQGLIVMVGQIDSEHKEEFRQHVKGTVLAMDPDYYFMAMEVWMSGNQKGIRPSLAEDKRECLMVSMYCKDGINRNMLKPFTKKNKKIIWEDEPEEIHQKGLTHHSTWNFFVEDVLDEVLERARTKVEREDRIKRFKEALEADGVHYEDYVNQMYESFKAANISGTREEFEARVEDFMATHRIESQRNKNGKKN